MTRTSRRALAGALALCLGAAGLTLLAPGASAAPPSEQEKTNSGSVEQGRTYDRFLVHFARGSAAERDDAAARSEVEQVARSAGRGLEVSRRISTGGIVVQVDAQLDKAQAD